MNAVRSVLLAIHFALYGFFFAAMVFSNAYYVEELRPGLIWLLLWTPVILLHVAFTFNRRSRGDTTHLERKAYRDGYQDAVRQLADNSYEPRQHVALDDDGELIEVPIKRKRSDN